MTFATASLPEAKEAICKPVMASWGNKASTVTTEPAAKPENITAKGTTAPSKDTNRSTEFIDDYTHKYYYRQLTKDQKEYYRYCFDQKRYLTVAPEPKKSDYDRRIALIAFNRDNPHLLLYPTKFSIDNGFTSMTAKKRNKILKIANSIADKAKQYDRDFDKIKAIHDGLNAMITYESGHEMVSAFLEGKADCSGYADAFCMVCQLAEIECVVVWGTAKNGAGEGEHAWNKVKISNNWYNVDVCWDDVKHDKYTYFLCSDKSFARNHTADKSISSPKAAKDYPVDYLGNETV